MARLVVLNDSGLAAGGATKLAIESAIGARSHGWDVDFFAQAGKLDQRLSKAGVNVHSVSGARVSSKSPFSALQSGLWNARALEEISNYIEAHDDKNVVYHLHNWSHFFSPAIFRALAQVQARTVLTTHDFFLSCGNGGQFNFKKNIICEKTGNSLGCLVTNCDKNSVIHKIWRAGRHAIRANVFPLDQFEGRVALIHEKQRPYFERAGLAKEQISTIKNPVTALVGRRVEAEKNKKLLFIGRISIEKGADIAAEAAFKSGMEIVFAGNGPLISKLKADYPNAKFAGFCSRDQLADLMRSSRALIMPGRWAEPFGLVAGEALWSGVPVLISETAFLAGDIIAAGAGLSFNPLKVDNVIDVIHQIKSDDLIVRKMSNAAFSNVKSIANTHEKWIGQYNDLYGSLV